MLFANLSCYWQESDWFKCPQQAYKLLRILTGYDLPGESWSGWRLSGNTLWSPEGKNFTASDLSYLSLTFAMARQWRIDQQEKRALGVRPKKSNLVPFVLTPREENIFG
ncbi:MAG: phage protein [Rhodospirillaceae bacterium]|nr:phage protein [Rhodospirillaceae bacterium]